MQLFGDDRLLDQRIERDEFESVLMRSFDDERPAVPV